MISGRILQTPIDRITRDGFGHWEPHKGMNFMPGPLTHQNPIRPPLSASFEQVTATIKESDALKELQQEIAREELDRAKTDEGNDLFQKLMDADRNSPHLSQTESPVIRLPSGGGINGSSPGSGEFKDGKYSPTFLRIDQKAKTNVIEIPINRSRPIGARKDAVNGYLDRPDNTGRVIVSGAVSSRFGIRPHLLNGRLTVFLTPIESVVKVGEVVVIRIELKDPAMAQSVRDEFSVRVIDEESPPQKPKKPKSKQAAPPKAGGKSDKEGGGEDKPTHGSPVYRLLTSDGRSLEARKRTNGRTDSPKPTVGTPKSSATIKPCIS